jgi:hypothetical protein
MALMSSAFESSTVDPSRKLPSPPSPSTPVPPVLMRTGFFEGDWPARCSSPAMIALVSATSLLSIAEMTMSAAAELDWMRAWSDLSPAITLMEGDIACTAAWSLGLRTSAVMRRSLNSETSAARTDPVHVSATHVSEQCGLKLTSDKASGAKEEYFSHVVERVDCTGGRGISVWSKLRQVSEPTMASYTQVSKQHFARSVIPRRSEKQCAPVQLSSKGRARGIAYGRPGGHADSAHLSFAVALASLIFEPKPKDT